MGELSAVILKKLDGGELAINDLFDFFVSRALEGSAHRLSKEGYKAFKKRSWQRRVIMNAKNQAKEERQRFHNLIHRLYEQGLITKENQGIKTTISVTKKGVEKYRALRKFLARRDPADQPATKPSSYLKIKSLSSIIVSFDIPEKEAHKRRWLRSALRNLDYKMLHESVWIGDNILPKDLLNEAQRMDMTKYLHIFSILKKGTVGD